jgi:3-oxoadipate enol-lactonase
MSPVPLHCTVDGQDDRPVLVLGAALGTTGAMWWPQIPALSAKLRVVRYDHRGHGGSPVPDGPYAIEDLGADVLALADSLGVQRFALGGISLGSFVALWIAEQHPERVSRLVLAGTAGRVGPPENWRTRAETVRAQGTEVIAETVVSRWLPEDFAAAHPTVREELLDAVLNTPAEGYAGCCGAVENMDLEPDLGRVTAPTLVIAGSGDPSTPPDLGRRVAIGIDGAQFEVITGAAHLANLSHPAEFTRLVLDFLTA